MVKLRKTNGRQLDCCGTCRHWRSGNPSAGEPDGRYCPAIKRELPHEDLRYFTCKAWAHEQKETFAVELWQELKGQQG